MTAIAIVSLANAAITSAFAQRRDPVGITPRTSVTLSDSSTVTLSADTIADSLKRPPISPRRAFFSSLLLPGLAQSKLDRPTASMLFAVMEVLSIGMLRKSAQDLREAKGAIKDSVYIGLPTDPVTGTPTSNGYIVSRYAGDRVASRRTHYEDWVAAIITNHLLSGADAYVAANLWDFRANVSVDPETKRTKVGASKSF